MKEEITNKVDKLSSIIEDVGLKVWEFSEVSFVEVKSSQYLKDVLKKNGFKITGEEIDGISTAFVSEYGSGKPVLGIMLEYDALPGLGNEAVPFRQARKDGVTSGHGCGHNLICAGALGAAVALKNLMIEKKIKGTIRVYGAAAEETEGAKVFMARAGLFNDVDAVLHWHPSDVSSVMNVRTAAATSMYVEFTGTSAHAGVYPWKGRSALHGVEIFLHSINLMREHVEPTARVHYVIKKGGEAPNIVPDFASVILTYRDADRKRVEKGAAWIKEMAQGAAMATQTKVLSVDYFGIHDLLPNTPLAVRMQKHLELVGLPQYTNQEWEFATKLQEAAGLEQTGMMKEILPMPNEPNLGGLTDVGDVSYNAPTMGVGIQAAPLQVGLHTWMATASHGTSIGIKAAVTAAKVLTLTGMDILTEPEFRKEIRADFEKHKGNYIYKSPVPEIIKEPAGLPAEMRQHQSIFELKESFYKASRDDISFRN